MRQTKSHYLRPVILRCIAALILCSVTVVATASSERTIFRRTPLQYIAALGEPGATEGVGAQDWGLWRTDPGPRGVWLSNYVNLETTDGVAPAQWVFDNSDWWLEENGVIMEQPEFPLPPGKYVVTGDRETMSVLTVYPEDAAGETRWELANDATLYDVTHLACRSARYKPIPGSNKECSPKAANIAEFPVTPGAVMPTIDGCWQQDYAVLFVVGVAIDQ